MQLIVPLNREKLPEAIRQWNVARDAQESLDNRRRAFLLFCWNTWREQCAAVRETGYGREEYDRIAALLDFRHLATAYVHRIEDCAKVGGVCLLIGALAWLIVR